ncbi:hypothetical protein EJB05_29570, partial [Eragrostis curvula]
KDLRPLPPPPPPAREPSTAAFRSVKIPPHASDQRSGEVARSRPSRDPPTEAGREGGVTVGGLPYSLLPESPAHSKFKKQAAEIYFEIFSPYDIEILCGGEKELLKGGAKASYAGMAMDPRMLTCEFESKWKTISRKMARKRSEPGIESVLQHREAALTRVETLMDCSHLIIKWRPS